MMFFIAGMSRCRTKWFSSYLSAYKGVTCHHEAINGLQSKQEFYDLMEGPGIVGNSDSGLFITDFQERWPNAPTLVLLRDPDDVTKSVSRFLRRAIPDTVQHRQFAAAKALKGLHVWYDEIDDRIEEIHAHLGIEFNEKVFKKYTIHNIQVKNPKVCLASYQLWGEFA